MLFEKIRKTRQIEQEQFDAIIREAKESEAAVIAVEKSSWGCDLSIPSLLASRSFSQAEQQLMAPLFERALCTNTYKDVFEDRAAVQVFDACAVKKQKERADARSFLVAYEQSHFIAVSKNFIKRNTNVTIVEVGCGLSTLMFQLDNGIIHWMEVDTKEVLQLRADLGFDRKSRVKQISCDSQNLSWVNQVKKETSENVVFIVHSQHWVWPAKSIKKLAHIINSQFSNALLLLSCVGGRAGKGKVGFHLFDLNAKSVFHSWMDGNPLVQVFETTYPPKEILETLKREERRRITRLYKDGNQILVDLKYTKREH